MRFVLIAAVALLLTASALHAQPSDSVPDRALGEPAFKVPSPWCQMGECYTSTIEEIQPVSFLPIGVLFKVSSQLWQSGFEQRTRKRFVRATDAFVFCSKQRPATLDKEGGGYRVTFLAPDKDDYGHANEPSYALYFAVCHGKVLRSPDVAQAFARSHGYHVPQAEDQPILKRPEDIVTYPARSTR